ncbi:TPA: ribosome biogenesis protein [Candidatus Woesearchaeota archaeon]|nr:ribosome biogenesis protein [Candidatus Woesearchaeota archaeon]HIH32197.1 ribosome biogenesis protein [Candidatus Woesearchaeota archaeon]HIH55584.1 ribosome biogenesis protein [Candidatus Woesearchaeota archaeon]HIJ02556.1 ribosome biogenesis protein [Candidatus Woesearchaeota archaeon]HIJ13398.1 ribosome biogenesis protein [Candidatus Woesearchaeota archaeon]
MKHILRCPKCHSYGLKPECECGDKRLHCKPPKLSVDDKYGKYRRMAKESANINKESVDEDQ